jgi:hypothetical protein
LALHDSVLLYNYKIKHDNTFEKKLISGNFNSNKSDSQFFDDTVKVNNETSVQYNTNMQNQMSGPNEDLLMPQPKVEFQS